MGGRCPLTLHKWSYGRTIWADHTRDATRTGGAGDRGYARARGPIDTYKGVSVCVVLWSLWVVGNIFAKEKTAKKEACVAGVLVVAVSKAAYAGALGRTYVRQVLAPTFYPSLRVGSR